MQGLQSILSLFLNEFNKFNNIEARILDSIHHMTFKLFKNGSTCNYGMLLNLYTFIGLLILLHGVISLPDAMSGINMFQNFFCFQ